MQLSQALSTATLIALSVVAQGLTQIAQCSDATFQCNIGGAACCGPFPAKFGYSVRPGDMPIGAQGWWFHGDQRELPSVGVELCDTPSQFHYRDDKGVEHSIRVPAGVADATEVIAQQYTNKDWKALASYQSA